MDKQLLSQNNDKQIVKLSIEDDFLCLRGLSPKKLRFEIEYSLGKGTTSNSFLLTTQKKSGDLSKAFLINPPGANFEEVFLPSFKTIISASIKEIFIFK